MSLWVYSLYHNNRLTSITLSGKIVKPDIKPGSKFHPYCQLSRVIIPLNAKSPACNWFNCILLQLPAVPSTAQPALGWQFLEQPQVREVWAPAGGISTGYSCRWCCWLYQGLGPRIWGQKVTCLCDHFNALDSWDVMTFALNCSGFVTFTHPERQNLESHRPLRNTAERAHRAPLTKKTITGCSYQETSPDYTTASFPAF